MESIMKIVKSLEDREFVIKIKIKQKKQKRGFLSMLLATLGAS